MQFRAHYAWRTAAGAAQVLLLTLCGRPGTAAASWTYAWFTSPNYTETNYVNPQSITIKGGASDYSDLYKSYTLITNVALWADETCLGEAAVSNASSGSSWQFVWTNPPAPPAAVLLKAIASAESGGAAACTLSIGISPSNEPPVAFNGAVRTVERTPVSLAPNFLHHDADQTCILTVETQPSDGAVTVEEMTNSQGNGSVAGGPTEPGQALLCFVYTPNPGFLGTNTFTFRVSDGHDDSNVATGTVTVATNTPPTARNVTNAVMTGAADKLTIYPACSDPDSAVQTLRPRVVSSALLGMVEATNTAYGAPCFLYTVPAGYVGRDTFTYLVNDGLEDSNVATGIVNIISNSAPVALPMRGVAAPGSSALLPVTYLDPDSGYGVLQSYSARSTQPPGHGALTTNGMTFTYTPDESFTAGVDSFRFVVSDGVDESEEAECRIQVRAAGDRAGSTVLVVVHTNLYEALSNEVDRLTADLAREGYTPHLNIWPSSVTSASNLWAFLKQHYDKTNQWLAGALLVGNLPKGTVTISGTTHYTDQVFWNMRAYLPAASPAWRDIWVSRIIAENNAYGSEAVLIRRALDANHACRTGASRLPFTAFYYINPEWWSWYSNSVSRLMDVWPSLECRGESKSRLRFAPELAQLSAYAGADAFARGGELLDETSHGNSDGYMAYGGWFARADLYRVIAQQRVALITSCSSGAYGGIVNHTIFTRGGGCVLAVGGSEINYVGDFTLAGSSRDAFRAALAGGESWGGAMIRSYPFSGAERTLMFGDLSLGAMAAAATNAMPRIRSCTWAEQAGRSVTFRLDAADDDGAVTNVEWFCEGYDAGRSAPSESGSLTTFTYTYPAPGVYPVRVEVTDDGAARDWREFNITVQGPPAQPLLLLSADSRITNLYVNGQPAGQGANAADWTKADIFTTNALREIALQALNDQPGSNAPGVLAKVLFPDGHAEVSDGTWKAYDGTDGPPPDDSKGRPWFSADYDDSGWAAAASAGALGVSPWGKPAGLALLTGAQWIWAGEPATNASSVYLRRQFVPWQSIDSDGDGMNDADESVAGTDRTNAGSRLTLSLDPAPSADGAALRFGAVSGRCYSVWWRADLTTGEWSRLPDWSNVWITNSEPVGVCFTNPAGAGFYRLGVTL